MFTVRIAYPREIDAREVLRGLQHAYQKGTDNALYVDCVRREEADLVVSNYGAQPGLRAEIVREWN